MKGFKVFVGLYCGALLIAGCALPVGEDYILSRDGNTAESLIYITDYNLQTYVPIPKEGERPIILVDNRGDLEVSVIWKDETGTKIPLPFATFAAHTVYKAEIQLTAKSGYAFYSTTPFAYHPGKITTQSDDLGMPTRIVTVTYNNSDDADITYITDYNLQSYIPIPMFGEKPVWGIDTRADMAVEVLRWAVKQSSGFAAIPSDGTYTFDLGAVYQADIKLAVKEGYRFSPVKKFEYFPGVVDTPLPEDNFDPNERILTTITYKPTRAPTEINDTNLTPYIPRPISGVTPVWSFAGSQYTGTITWKNTETQAVLAAPFQSGVEYTAEVAMTPASGYTFAGVGADVFTNTGAKTVTNPADSGAVRIDFPVTADAGPSTVVYDTDLTGRIPRPVAGMNPVPVIAGSQYTGKVTWVPPHNTFRLGTEYTAVVNLTPVSGFTFTNIAQDSFTHTGARTVTNSTGSGTVTINFSPAPSPTYLVIKSFGPVTHEDSALHLMRERKNENYPLAIDLPAGEEPISSGLILVAGNNSPTHVLINGHNRTLTLSQAGTLITVGAGVSLTLQNITLQGLSTENDAPLVVVGSGGKLTLGTGAVLTGNRTSADAGGVWVKGGELVMNAGAVIEKMSARYGGGVQVDAGGRFSMSGGTIGGPDPARGNTVSGPNSGGGVLVAGVFDMDNGLIQSNVQSDSVDAEGSAGGICVLPGGIFTMYDGTIQSNTNEYNGTMTTQFNNMEDLKKSAGGVCVLADYYYDDDGYGTVFWGTFNMYGGTIKNNTAQENNAGGGVYNIGAFHMRGGTITGNTNTSGPHNFGVYADGGESSKSFVFAMSGSARVTWDNKVALLTSALLTLDGILTASERAANLIIYDDPNYPNSIDDFVGAKLLVASDPLFITGNADKFLYNDDDSAHIVLDESVYPGEPCYGYIQRDEE